MSKLKKILQILLISSVSCTFTGITIHATPQTDNSINNPYVQMYLTEKKQKSTEFTSNSQPKDYLVDPKTEEEIIINTLNEYYKEDKDVVKILKKYIKDTNLELNTLATKKDGKINTMRIIEKLYWDVKDNNEQEILKGYLKRYARSSKDDISISFYNNLIPTSTPKESLKENMEKQNNFSTSTLTTNILNTASYTGIYNAPSAGDWAYNNYSSYNSNFPAFNNGYGSDCTNFVSQAMNIGGKMPMQGNWYCYAKNYTYPNPSSATQLNYSWSLSDPSPWISVTEFEKFWSSRATTFYCSTSYYQSNHATVYNRPIYRGHVVILHKGISDFITVPTHCMIISKYDYSNQDFLLAGHSNNRQAYPLLQAISSYAEIEFISF